MRARTLNDLLKAGDRVAVSNVTGREAGTVSVASHRYCGNVVGGWALGKGGQSIEVPGGEPIPVFATVEDLMNGLPQERRPNKIIAYSPPGAVYGDVKEVVEYGRDTVETIFVITEHVSIEVTAKIARLCSQADIDVVGERCDISNQFTVVMNWSEHRHIVEVRTATERVVHHQHVAGFEIFSTVGFYRCRD